LPAGLGDLGVGAVAESAGRPHLGDRPLLGEGERHVFILKTADRPDNDEADEFRSVIYRAVLLAPGQARGAQPVVNPAEDPVPRFGHRRVNGHGKAYGFH